MPEYVAPTISDTGDAFPATFPVELAGTVVFVDFEVQEYTPPDSTNVNFDVGGSFEQASVEVAFDTSITEGIGFAEQTESSVGFTPDIEESMAGGDANEDLSIFEFGDSFPGTFPFELGPDEPAGVIFDVQIRDVADIEQIYGETLADAEKTTVVAGTGEKDTIVLTTGESQLITLGNAEVN